MPTRSPSPSVLTHLDLSRAQRGRGYRAPTFWQRDGVLPRLLAPLSAVTAAVTALRLRREGWFCPVPVICVGNVTVGGAGKTTVTLDLARRLVTRGWGVHVLLRGYGGSARGLHWVEPDQPASLAGDEALLHAAIAPTWTCADRKLGAQALLAACAEVVLMDDGLQNPGVQKRLSLLAIDGASGFGNGRVFPAGPLREPVPVGTERCQAAVLIGTDATGAATLLSLPVLRARLVPDGQYAALAGRHVLAFAGIARPDKFFSMLADSGARIASTRAFADHHAFRARELRNVLEEATRCDAVPVTTTKDAVRLPAGFRDRVTVVGVSLAWEEPTGLEALLSRVV